MKKAIPGALIAIALTLVGCSGNGGGGTLDITENGTYDVSGYDQVVVAVGDEIKGESDGSAETMEDGVELNLVRTQFKYFSMEVPEDWVGDYTEQELTENDIVQLIQKYNDGNDSTLLAINAMDTHGVMTLEDFSDGPQEDVSGITMAIKHEHMQSQRVVMVDFIENDLHYSISLYYPVSMDDVFSEYAVQFYRTIQMN